MKIVLLRHYPLPALFFQVCGHLWSNDYYINEYPTSENEGVDRFPNGICYVANANFEQVKKLRPCVDGEFIPITGLQKIVQLQ